MKKILYWMMIPCCLLPLSGCKVAAEIAGQNQANENQSDSPPGDSAVNITVQSSAFAGNAAIPVRYTGDGEDVSPPLTWSGVPREARELVLIMDDPDAPSAEPWVHWVLYKLSPATTSLRQGLATSEQLDEPRGALQGKNSWGTVGYRGPAPPPGHGLHHYHFTVYALDAPLALPAGASKQELLQAMEGHILLQGELVGTYQRR